MLYLFHGSDAEKVRTKAFEWVHTARSKEPNLAYARIARDEVTPSVLEDISASGGLFVRRVLALIDDPFFNGNKNAEEESHSESSGDIEAYIDALALSDNAVVILAPNLSASTLKKLLTKVKKEYRFDKANSSEKKRGFNSALVDALGRKEGEDVWTELHKAMLLGDAPEMLHGLLHWKARDMMQKGSRLWTKEESRALSMNLIEILQNSRRGRLNLRESLEQFALSLHK